MVPHTVDLGPRVSRRTLEAVPGTAYTTLAPPEYKKEKCCNTLLAASGSGLATILASYTAEAHTTLTEPHDSH